MAELIEVYRIIEDQYREESANPEWVKAAFAKEDFLVVNNTVRLKVGKDEVYATWFDVITFDEETGAYGIIRSEVPSVHS